MQTQLSYASYARNHADKISKLLTVPRTNKHKKKPDTSTSITEEHSFFGGQNIACSFVLVCKNKCTKKEIATPYMCRQNRKKNEKIIINKKNVFLRLFSRSFFGLEHKQKKKKNDSGPQKLRSVIAVASRVSPIACVKTQSNMLKISSPPKLNPPR